jgi:hypothetical protein
MSSGKGNLQPSTQPSVSLKDDRAPTASLRHMWLDLDCEEKYMYLLRVSDLIGGGN